MVKRTGLGKCFDSQRSQKHQKLPQIPCSLQMSQSAVTTQSASVTTQSAQAAYYDSQAEDIEGELPIQEPTQKSDEPALQKKLVRLMVEQEEAMADWLKDNTVLFNKGKKK